MSTGRRILFLDDDPARGAAFLNALPGSLWVKSASECIEQLGEPWDEVHLDHDLGGERFVDHQREDCGMAVVRWLCEEPRPHLEATRFIVHTHNPEAACVMAFHLETMGYAVLQCPFGTRPHPEADGPSGRRSWLGRMVSRLSRRS
jgi:hypothetical protein